MEAAVAVMKRDAWRLWDLRRGLATNGYHDFLMDEIEFGPRVAMALDEDDQAWWVLHDDEVRRALIVAAAYDLELQMRKLDEERCEWSDLLVDHCAHCLGHAETPDPLTEFRLRGTGLRPNGIPEPVEFPSQVPGPRDE